MMFGHTARMGTDIALSFHPDRMTGDRPILSLMLADAGAPEPPAP